MSATLIIKHASGEETLACKKIVTIGRDPGCDIVLDDLQVSRNHALLRRLGNGDYYLVDEGSSNGSYINGKLITAPTLLRDGDCLEIGETEIRFCQQSVAAADAADVSFEDTVIIAPKGEIRTFTILVADIRDYTSISENTPIKALTLLMNEWFNRTRECIYEHHGIVDKFIGDCVYARWEVRDDPRSSVVDAMSAAAELNFISSDLNRSFPKVSKPLKIGVGINTGTAAIGAGVSESAIGDAVNLTFRLESATKQLGKDVIIGRGAYEHLPDSVWQSQQSSIQIKGKSDPVYIWGLKFTELQTLLDQISATSFN
jgi:adenylate cyclase